MCHKPWIVCLIYKHTHSAHLYRCTLHLINLIKLYVLYILLHPPSYYCHIDTNTLSMYIVRMLVVRYNTQLITRYAHHVCQTCWGGQTSVAGVWSSNIILIYCNVFFLYRKNLFMKEKLNKKEQHKLYTLFTIYRSNIVGKTNQFKHNSLFINLFCLQYYLSQWSWPKIDTLLLRI